VSETQYIFIDKKNIPCREKLQSSISSLGYRLELDSEFSFFETIGFSPCILEGNTDAGFEIDSCKVEEAIDDDESLLLLSGGRDFCICLSWGSSFADCAAVSIVSAVLVKQFDAIVTFDGEEQESFDDLNNSIAGLVDDISNESEIIRHEASNISDEEVIKIYEETISSLKKQSIKRVKKSGLGIKVEFSNGNWIKSPKCEIEGLNLEDKVVESIVQKNSVLVLHLLSGEILEFQRAKLPDYEFTHYVYSSIFTAKYKVVLEVHRAGPHIKEFLTV